MAEVDIEQLGELVKQLSAVQDELLALGPDDHEARNALLSRQSDLREQVRQFHQDPDAGRSRADLERELESLQARLEAIRGERIDPVVQAGGGDTGIGNIGVTELNRGIMEAQGGAPLKERIAQIEARLEKLDSGG